MTVLILAANTGESAGNFEAVFRINGSEVERRNIELQPGKDLEARFTFTPDHAGDYTVDINGIGGQFSAINPTTTTTIGPKPDYNVVRVSWLWLGVGIGSVVLIGLLIILLVWRLGRREKR